MHERGSEALCWWHGKDVGSRSVLYVWEGLLERSALQVLIGNFGVVRSTLLHPAVRFLQLHLCS